MDRWVEELEFQDRGRSWSHSPFQSTRGRECLQHASEDWERCRSRSPAPYRARTATPLPVSPDPMLHVYRESEVARGAHYWDLGGGPHDPRVSLPVDCWAALRRAGLGDGEATGPAPWW
jgi:hypothetical protein